jgi:pimeloyl-ACP methyl ester carboxylesterase
MRNSFLHTLLLLTLGCNCTAQATAPASSEPLVPRSQTTLEHVSFTTEDGAIIYADLYGAGERGVVLAHGGQFNKGSWRAQAEQLASAGFRVLAFDFRGFGQSHGPGDSDMYSAPMRLDVLAAVDYLRKKGTRSVAVVGASFGGSAAVDACISSPVGTIQRVILLAAEPDGPAQKLRVPLLFIVARNDASGGGSSPRLARIRAWFEKAPEPKQLIVLDGSAHAQFLFQSDQGERVMQEILWFLSQTGTTK